VDAGTARFAAIGEGDLEQAPASLGPLSTLVADVDEIGRLVYDGTVDDLKAHHGQYRTLVVDLERPNGPLDVAGAEVVRVEGPRQWLRFHRDRTTAAELIAGIARTTPILDLTVEEPLIEDVIAQMYAGNRTGDASV
jgi:ABC-type uncharacterized transport system ATPase subunit